MSEWSNTNPVSPPAPRNWKQAMGRGLRCKCPNCGEGRMFRSFLKAVPACETCGEALDVHRADDMPPYITITIVGHIIVGLNLFVEQGSDWPLWWHMVLWPSLALILTLLIMQPVKGALIGYQWALRMHGFDPAGDFHAIDHAAFGLNIPNAENVIDNNKLEHVVIDKPASTLSRHALARPEVPRTSPRTSP